MGHMAWRHGLRLKATISPALTNLQFCDALRLPAWRNPFERPGTTGGHPLQHPCNMQAPLYKTALVWEEHQGLIVSITIWIHWIEHLGAVKTLNFS